MLISRNLGIRKHDSIFFANLKRKITNKEKHAHYQTQAYNP
jgi:hypothetical protein